MQYLFMGIPFPLTVGLFFLLGMCAGTAAAWLMLLVREEDEPALEYVTAGLHSSRWWQWIPIVGFVGARRILGERDSSLAGWGIAIELGTGLLFAAFVVAMVRFGCQQTPEVRPDGFWFHGRIFYHLILIALLVAATATDFRCYIIPDFIAFTGVIIGVLGAVISGQLQMIHIWVDWNQEVPGLHGPYFPDWLDTHRHLHGLAWSAAGLFVGAGITWFVRIVSAAILKQHALGFGDVTLMAMIGSFIGWQPVIFVFLLAPMCGIVVGLGVRFCTGKTFVPYGPYLSAAAVIVLFSWKWLWLLTRTTLGDWPSIAKLAGFAATALVLLLVGIRLYRAIPVKRIENGEPSTEPIDQT